MTVPDAVRELIVMGGTLTNPGNVTPVAEFNIGTDPEAASLLFALTSTTSKTNSSAPRLSRPLKLILAPLDATHKHGLYETFYNSVSATSLNAGSPLSAFLDAILQRTFRKVRSLVTKGRESEVVELHMHDPLCVYFAMLDDTAREKWVVERDVDVRVECAGTWTRGMTVLDQRVRKSVEAVGKLDDDLNEGEDTTAGDYQGVDDDEGEWRGGTGNRLQVIWASSTAEGGNLKTVEAMAKLLWHLES
jgi:inosine-uridine nucleoside N-ribohydrolase